MEGPEANLELIGVGEGNCNHSSSKNNTKERNYAWSPRSRPGHSRQLFITHESTLPSRKLCLRERITPNPNPASAKGTEPESQN